MQSLIKQYAQKSKYGLLYTESIEDNQNISRYVVNRAKEMKFNYDIKIAEAINKKDTKFGHLKHLCSCMNINFENFQDLSLFYAAVTIRDKLDHYLNRPLFGREKLQFIEMLQKNILKPLQGGYKISTINKYFENIQLPYYIEEKKDNRRKSQYYGKRGFVLKVKPQSGKTI